MYFRRGISKSDDNANDSVLIVLQQCKRQHINTPCLSNSRQYISRRNGCQGTIDKQPPPYDLVIMHEECHYYPHPATRQMVLSMATKPKYSRFVAFALQFLLNHSLCSKTHSRKSSFTDFTSSMRIARWQISFVEILALTLFIFILQPLFNYFNIFFQSSFLCHHRALRLVRLGHNARCSRLLTFLPLSGAFKNNSIFAGAFFCSFFLNFDL